MVQGSHLAARVRAPTAALDAALHLLVILRDGFTTARTRLTYFCTGFTNVFVQTGAAKQKIGRGLADLCTVQQNANMMRFCKFTASFEAVNLGFQASLLAVATLCDAMLQLRIGHLLSF
jgi:hypothetical protein